MSTRFEPSTIEIDGKRTRGLKVKCGACPISHTVVSNSTQNPTGGDVLVDKQAIRKFENAGWRISTKHRSGDRCPACVKEEAQISKSDENARSAAPPEPRQMSRDDRRIIFEKLNDVYVDDKTGYEGAWTDQGVATDLGVPRAWVEQVREEMFGGLGTNPAMRAQIDEAKRLHIACSDLLCQAIEQHNAIVRRVTDLSAELKKSESILRDIEKAIAPL